ncbi:MAG: Lrp/AsnC family transcriptional regulator [Armatimonadetes bacterium]|nr:Lrp/AsnC family transcriptional regulator [Armatimonadota bacterium]
MEKVLEILEILESDARLEAADIAVMLGMEKEEVQRTIKELEKNKIILRYMTLVNWEKAGDEKVMAMIEVRVAPQREVGYDAVAERICRFPEVRSVRLVSGAYDLAVFIEGKSMREISNFVATKLATIEGVLSTATHFILKTYKQDGVMFEDGEKDRRLAVSP